MLGHVLDWNSRLTVFIANTLVNITPPALYTLLLVCTLYEPRTLSAMLFKKQPERRTKNSHDDWRKMFLCTNCTKYGQKNCLKVCPLTTERAYHWFRLIIDVWYIQNLFGLPISLGRYANSGSHFFAIWNHCQTLTCLVWAAKIYILMILTKLWQGLSHRIFMISISIYILPFVFLVWNH